MKNLEAYRKQIDELEALISKLEKGDLSVDELVNLERITRELHEKSIILKYKAFENKAQIVPESIVEESAPIVEIIEAPVFEEPVEEVTPDFDFDIFEKETETEGEAEIEITDVTEGNGEIESELEEVREDEEVPVLEPIASSSDGTSFWEKVNLEDNSLSSQFAGSKIETLIGVFGLNDRLRYINDLFDGSSEMFGDAIKLLDSQADIDAAKERVGELASEHDWDPEEETVVEFMSVVNRRYA